MAWLTTATDANKVIREQRTTKERWVYATNPPVTLTRDITTTVFDYVGIAAGSQATIRAALISADTSGAIVDCYYSEGEGGGGTIHVTTLTGTEWTRT